MAQKKNDDEDQPKVEKREVEANPIITAALIDDPDDDDNEKARRAEVLGSEEDSDEDEDDDQGSDGKDKSKKKPASKDSDDDEEDDDGDDSEDEDESDDKKPKVKKGQSEDDSDDEDEDDPKLSRKERRDQRKQRFIDSIKEKQPDASARDPIMQVQPYNPLDYEQQDEFKTDVLEKDRNAFGDYRFSQGARIERYYAQQERFWDRVEHDNELLLTNPSFSFLDETSSDFDEDKAADVNELYLNLCGYQENKQVDGQGRPVIDPATGQQRVTATVRRTDISYRKFVEQYVKRMQDWASEEVAETAKEIAKQRQKQGIRPGGSGKKAGLGKLRPGMISTMSDEDFEKNEAEIDAQILDMLQ